MAISTPPPSSVPNPPRWSSEFVRRRVPHIAAAYLGGVWTFFQFVQWAVDRYTLPPQVEEAVLVGFLLLIPMVGLLAWRHGAPGRQPWRRSQSVFVVANACVAGVAAGLLLTNQPLQASFATGLETADTYTAAPSNRRQVALFAFENPAQDTSLAWLETGLPVLLKSDLEQYPGLTAATVHNLAPHLREHGFSDGKGAPLALQREIARQYLIGHLLSGSVGRGESGEYIVTTQLYDAESGKRIAERRAAGPAFLPLVDSLTAALIADLDAPAAATDLPVAEVTSADTAALKAYVASLDASMFGLDAATADAHLAEATIADPTFAAAHVARYFSLSSLRRQTDALAALAYAQRYRYRLPERTQFMVNYIQLSTDEKPDEALRVLQQWTAYAPNDTRALSYLYQVYLSRGETDAGIRTLRTLIDLDPVHRKHLYYLGDLYMREQRYDEALATYQEYTDAFPRETVGLLRRGYTLTLLNRWDEALAAYRDALAADPSDLNVPITLANAYTRTGRFDEAEQALDKAASLAMTVHDSVTVTTYRATYESRRGRWMEATRHYDAVWRMKASYTTPVQLLHDRAEAAELYARAGRRDDAQRFVDEARTDPSYEAGSVHSRLDLDLHAFETALALEDVPRARQAFDAFAALQDATIEANKMREFEQRLYLEGRLLVLEGTHEAAVERFRAYLETMPAGYAIWSDLGDALFRLGRTREAEQAYDRALTLYPASPQAHLGLAKIRHAQRRTDEAVEHIAEAMATWADADEAYAPAAEARALQQQLTAL